VVHSADFVPRIAAKDGAGLRILLHGQLGHPEVRKITILSYRYNDFDFVSGRVGNGGPNALGRLLLNRIRDDVSLTLVTGDPFEGEDRLCEKKFQLWWTPLHQLHKDGATVKIHPRLHAKVYLFESQDDRKFYAVGSSNLTQQGMGFQWAECNVVGYHGIDFSDVTKRVAAIVNDQLAEPLDDWVRRKRRGMGSLRFAGL